MLSRRHLLARGLGVAAAGAMPWPAFGRIARLGSPPRLNPSTTGAPFLTVDDSVPTIDVGGYPFAAGFTGDPFDRPHARFPEIPAGYLGPLKVPKATEHVDIVIIGGGISGLTTAYLLRDHNPLVFDLLPRFGGVAAGEVSNGVPYSLGGAYVIEPDPGTTMEQVYGELGLDAIAQIDSGRQRFVIDGAEAEGFWDGEGVTRDEAASIHAFIQVVKDMAGAGYPEIPLPDGPGAEYVRQLDMLSFKQHITNRMFPAPLTPLLSAAIQSYCYSSFGSGWTELSAAAGWNFLAAEEFDRWIFPGGNASLVQALWQALYGPNGEGGSRLLNNATVFDVRNHPDGSLVTWFDGEGNVTSIIAQRVVFACPKHVARRVMPTIEQLDPAKWDAMLRLRYRAYVVVNVLLDAPIDLEFYDLFLLGDGESFPMTPEEVEANSKVVDLVDGNFGTPESNQAGSDPSATRRRVLTLYWPLSWTGGRFTLVLGDDSWHDYAKRLGPQLDEMLTFLGVPKNAVRQVRMTHWGHAMPIAEPGFIADGDAEAVRAPIDGRYFFVNQDNWALPAVENCMLDAGTYAPMISEGL